MNTGNRIILCILLVTFTLLTEDFNQIIPRSPTGQVDAVVMPGDMNPIDSGTVNTEAAYRASTARNIPAFYVVGNHGFISVMR